MARRWILLSFLLAAACDVAALPTTTTGGTTTSSIVDVGDRSASLCQSAFRLATAETPEADKAAELVLAEGFDAAECPDEVDKGALAGALFGASQCEAAKKVDPLTYGPPICSESPLMTSAVGACAQALALATDTTNQIERAAAIVLAEDFDRKQCNDNRGALANALFLGDQCEASQLLDESSYPSSVCPASRVDRARESLLPLAVFILVILVAAAAADRLGQSRWVAGFMLGRWIRTSHWRRGVGLFSLGMAVASAFLLVAQFLPDIVPIVEGGPFPGPRDADFWIGFSWWKISAALALLLLGLSVYRHGLEPPIKVSADVDDDKSIVEKVRAVAAGEPGGADLVTGREDDDDIKLDSAVVSSVGPGALGFAASAIVGLRRLTEYTISAKIEGLEPAGLVIRTAVQRGKRLVKRETFLASEYGVTPDRLTGEKADQETFVKQLLMAVGAVWSVRTIEGHFFGSSRIFGTAEWRSAALTVAGVEWHRYLSGAARDDVERSLYSEALSIAGDNYAARFNLGYIAAGDPEGGFKEANERYTEADRSLVAKAPELQDCLIQRTTRQRMLLGPGRMVLRVRYNIVASALNEWARRRAAINVLTSELDRLILTPGLPDNVRSTLKSQRDTAARICETTDASRDASVGRAQAAKAGELAEVLTEISTTPGLPDVVVVELGRHAAGARELSANLGLVGDLALPLDLKTALEPLEKLPGLENDKTDPLRLLVEALPKVLQETPGVCPDTPTPVVDAALQSPELSYLDACRFAAHASTRGAALERLAQSINWNPADAAWARKDPCFFELRMTPGQARAFDAMTLTSDEGLAAVYCLNDDIIKAMKAFGIIDRKALCEASSLELSSLAFQHKVNSGLVRKAAEVTKIESQSWPGTTTALTITDANLVHKAGYRSVAALDEAQSKDVAAVVELLRSTNGSNQPWEGKYGSWSAIKALANRETISTLEESSD